MQSPSNPTKRFTGVSGFGRMKWMHGASFLLIWVALLPALVQAQFEYTTDNGRITITGYTGLGGVLNIPSQINGLPVTAIGDWGFSRQASLVSVTVPDGVSTIGVGAFYACSTLGGIMLPDSVVSIGASAFDGCVQLTSLTIPQSVSSIGGAVFHNCSGLNAIAVHPANSHFTSLEGVLFNKSQTTLIQCPARKSGNYVIPGGVSVIGDGAFSDCNDLTGISIPDSVTTIGVEAFIRCVSITTVRIPDSTLAIGNGAFSGCSTLTSLTLGNNVKTIGIGAFESCSNLAAITLPESLLSLGESAFYGCSKLTTVKISKRISDIGRGAFDLCDRLNAITVDADNFFYSALDGVLFDKSESVLIRCPGGKSGGFVIPDNVSTIWDWAFYHCGYLTGITIGNNVTNVGVGAFANCSSLTQLNIPDRVVSIGDNAWGGCTRLASLTIGRGVVRIGQAHGPYSNNGLSNITVHPLNRAYSSLDGVLFDKSRTLLLIYPETKAGDYALPSTVTRIGAWAFSICNRLTNITIPDSVHAIGPYAFGGCTNLTKVALGTGLMEIQDGAFNGCSRLASLTFPSSLRVIGQGAFSGCPALTQAFFYGDAPQASEDAFSDATTAYYLPGTLGWESTFVGCPTAKWSLPYPWILGNGSLRVQNDRFGFTASWATGPLVVVEVTTNLENPIWESVSTNVLTGGSADFSDPHWTNSPSRFYRLRLP